MTRVGFFVIMSIFCASMFVILVTAVVAAQSTEREDYTKTSEAFETTVPVGESYFENTTPHHIRHPSHNTERAETSYVTTQPDDITVVNTTNSSETNMTSFCMDDDIFISDEKKLVAYLMRRYKKIGTMGRPVHNASAPVVVYFGLGLLKMDIVESENQLSIAVWARYRWRDEYLQWDPNLFSGIRSVKLLPRTIWMPDIELYNTASTERYEREVMLLVGHDGHVTWFPHRIFHSSCAIDVKRFPFDNQTCHLWFGSWTHTKQEIELELAFSGGMDLSTFRADFKEISEWEITEVVAERLSDQESSNFAVMTFALHLQRRMTFSSYILTLPVVFMSFLTLLVFWLPANSADKSNIGLTIFGSLLLLLLILLEAAPPTASAVPMLGIYYCFNIVIVMLSIFLSSIVTKLVSDTYNLRMRKRVPKWIRKRMFPMTCFLCLDKPPTLKDHKEINIGEAERECLLATVNTAISHAVHQIHGQSYSQHNNQPDNERITPKAGTDESNSSNNSNSQISSSQSHHSQLLGLYLTLNALCRTLSAYLSTRTVQERRAAEKRAIIAEWQHLAAMLDRIFLISYLVIILISLAFLFPR